MAKNSAGILLYKLVNQELQVMLVHPGGPLHAKRDLGAWSIPKGEYTEDEDPLACAKREFEEETGKKLPEGQFIKLTPITQKGGKNVHAWALRGDIDVSEITSNTFLLEWPPKSGRQIEVPEIDKAEWFDVLTAKEKINVKQVDMVDELIQILSKR